MPAQNPAIQTQVDQFLHAFRNLDLLMIDLLLDEHLTYQDFPKPVFLQKLGIAFRNFRENGNSQLLCFPSHCGNGCGVGPGKSGFLFVGDSSPQYLTLIIHSEEGKIRDLFECNNMAARRIVPRCDERIWIDTASADEPPF